MKSSTFSKRGTIRLVALILLISLLILAVLPFSRAVAAPLAATSPTLGEAQHYSVLAGQTVTCTGTTTTQRRVGVNPGSAITGFPVPCIAGKGTNSANASAASAQLDNTAAFTSLGSQGCDVTYPTGTKDLVGENLIPGVYCADAFTLSGTLTLSGSGVWIFKSAADLITSSTANVVGGDPCNVWWREVSSVTLGTNTSFIGNILASTSIVMQTGATLNGRVLAQTGSVTLDSNTISGPNCTVPIVRNTQPPAPTATSAPANTQAPAPTATTTTVVAPTEAATTAPVVGLPSTGGGPQPRNDSVWGMLLVVPVVGALIGGLGLLKRRRGRQAKG